MALRLKYTDEYGETKNVPVSDEVFTVGRHSENDLCIPDNRLSREHIRIEQFNDTFYVSDSNSSNGTTLNGTRLSEAAILKSGDRLNLGDAVKIQIEIGSGAKDVSQSAVVGNSYSVKDEVAYSPNSEISSQYFTM